MAKQPFIFPTGSYFIVKSFMEKIQNDELKKYDDTEEEKDNEKDNKKDGEKEEDEVDRSDKNSDKHSDKHSDRSSEGEIEHCSEESCDEIFFTLLNMYRYHKV